MEYNTAYYSHHLSAVSYAQCHDIFHVVCEYDAVSRIKLEYVEIENIYESDIRDICDGDVPISHRLSLSFSSTKLPPLSACPFALLLPTTSFLFLRPTPPCYAIRRPRSQRVWSVTCLSFNTQCY
jgi:hypothetical protein